MCVRGVGVGERTGRPAVVSDAFRGSRVQIPAAVFAAKKALRCRKNALTVFWYQCAFSIRSASANVRVLGGMKMAKAKAAVVPRTNTEIRRIILQYFYDRNKNATSARGKKGSAVRISDVKKDLKTGHGLTQQEVQSNLTYLIIRGGLRRTQWRSPSRHRAGPLSRLPRAFSE